MIEDILKIVFMLSSKIEQAALAACFCIILVHYFTVEFLLRNTLYQLLDEAY